MPFVVEESRRGASGEERKNRNSIPQHLIVEGFQMGFIFALMRLKKIENFVLFHVSIYVCSWSDSSMRNLNVVFIYDGALDGVSSVDVISREQ